VESGLHKGSKAIGRWALMPETVRGVSRDLSNKQSLLYKTMGPGYKDKEVQALQDLSDEELHEKMTKDPSLEKRVARYMASRLDRFEGDELDKVFRWNQGTSLKKADIDPAKRDEHEYIKKYLALDDDTKLP
jgi:hypothetical protein